MGSAETSTPVTGPLSAVISLASSISTNVVEALYQPLSSCSVLSRQWENISNCYILRPKNAEPKAIVHFIGGAFVGAAPHITYRSFLERLAANNYMVVATPYDLSLDYLGLTAEVAENWSQVSSILPTSIPVLGIGHSAGALFHALGASLYGDAFENRANVLISYNNKPASDAIPAYGSIFAPAFQNVAQFEQSIPEELRAMAENIPNTLEDFLIGNPITPDRLRDNIIPAVRESRRVVEQLPPLVREIGTPGDSGPPEFYPPPGEVRASVAGMYNASRTLVVQFENDAIDESGLLEEMVRARAEGSVESMKIRGTHVTPLLQDAPFEGLRPVAEAIGSRDLESLVSVIDEWFMKENSSSENAEDVANETTVAIEQ